MSENDRRDRRIERTQTLLWQALFDLLRETGWHKVNVSKICRRADVARSSFYLHFQNKQELLDYGFRSGLRDARSEIAGFEREKTGFATLHWLTHHIYHVHGLQRSKLVEDTYIYSRFQRAFAELFAEELRRRGKTVDSHVLSFVMGGTFSMIQDWVESDSPVSHEKLSLQLNQLAAKFV